MFTPLGGGAQRGRQAATPVYVPVGGGGAQIGRQSAPPVYAPGGCSERERGSAPCLRLWGGGWENSERETGSAPCLRPWGGERETGNALFTPLGGRGVLREGDRQRSVYAPASFPWHMHCTDRLTFLFPFLQANKCQIAHKRVTLNMWKTNCLITMYNLCILQFKKKFFWTNLRNHFLRLYMYPII